MTGRTQSRPARRPLRRCARLSLELLEDRSMLDAGIAGGTQLLLVTRAGAVETVSLPAGANVQQALAGYQANPNILSAEADQQVGVDFIPNDTRYPQQWDLLNANDADIDADQA